jgi:hypothetical protein
MLVGVETKLIDASPSYPGGASAFIPTIVTFAEKGPVNQPVLVGSASEALQIFGEAVLAKKQYGMFAAYEFFKQGSGCWIIRAGADMPGYAETTIKARDGKPLMTLRYKSPGEFGNSLRCVFQDVNPINFDGVVTMQILVEMLNPLTPAEWAASETTDYPEFIPVPGKNRFNVDFATQRVYSAIDDEDQVNHFGEYLYSATANEGAGGCVKQVNEIVSGNETEDFMFIFEREPFTSTILIEKLKATVNFAGGSNAIETAWAPIFNLAGFKKYDAARAEFRAESDVYTMAKNEYVQLPINVQKYVRDNNILVIGGLTLRGMGEVVLGDKLKDWGNYNGFDSSNGSVAYATAFPLITDTALADTDTVTLRNSAGVEEDITLGSIRDHVMPLGGDVNDHDYYLSVDEDKFLMQELFKMDCPQVADGPETIDPIEGTGRDYNVTVQFANAAEVLADIIEKMNNIKKDPANQAYRVEAISPGEWGNNYQVSIDYAASTDEVTFHIFEERGPDLVEVEAATSASNKADLLTFINVAISHATPVDSTNVNTVPVNDVDPDTGAELPMPLMGGADMFTEADYDNDMKLAPYIAGSVAHQTGVWAAFNFEEYAYKALACPYFSQFGMVSGEMVSMAENRRDFHAIVDTPDLTPPAAVNWRTSGNHNSKFESIYFPWLMKLDPYTKKVVPVPASGSALQSMALSIKNGKICDAPAGTTRGVIFDAVAVSKDIKLSQVMRDRLYGMGINPIVKGLTSGICIMGQKTTYAKTSPMQKVGTMLMIEQIVRDLTLSGKNYVFDLSIPSLWTTIQDSFQAYLNTYVSSECLAEASADVSATYNPPIVLAQSKLNALVAIKPSPYMEHLIIPISVS